MLVVGGWTLQDLMGKVRVVVRVRKQLEGEDGDPVFDLESGEKGTEIILCQKEGELGSDSRREP